MSGMANSENRCVFVYGNEGCADRARLQREFGEFGRVKKIFTENSGKYSKVYFDNIEKCKEVADAFKVNHFGWVVQYPNCGGDNREFESNLRTSIIWIVSRKTTSTS
ncbi:unnamed protein product [Acanthoscelides obtectus]|uniref:RRM domain-containing protein n=1 Tax=Acanthoscelides obtectus TaxID=200917 RepID=A0A9P0PSN7_ACAOB|nr:unnamed protein product [Acanthoscelides obtectus]CAK1659578.1 hypothetical protein AOBTE_LOCUS21551 [Acanthoscelides obtectus]